MAAKKKGNRKWIGAAQQKTNLKKHLKGSRGRTHFSNSHVKSHGKKRGGAIKERP